MSIGKWKEVDGDNTYAIDWPLDRSSVVFEVGAFKGRWAKQIIDKYGCEVHCFEPQDWAYNELLDLHNGNYPNLIPHHFALGIEDKQDVPMGEYETDACSFLHVGERVQGTGVMVDASKILTYHVDLMMINIEGYEYELLRHLINTHAITKIQRLCVQYHTFADPDERLHKILVKWLEYNGFKMWWSFYPTLEAMIR
jgi:FkbM family methyltransferase